MQYRRLGRAGIQVSELALGSWLTYGTTTERDVAEQCVHTAYELGINHFDCANVYGAVPHAAESFLGKALKPFDRTSYVLTTKAFWPVGDRPNQAGLSRKHLREQIEKSLRALATDYVDIFYCHRFDPQVELEEILTTLDAFIREGKILYSGVSEWQAAHIAEAAQLAEHWRLHPIRASQPAYNLLHRAIEPEILPLCERLGIGVVAFSPLAQGVLSGKYHWGTVPPAGSRATHPDTAHFVARHLTEATLRRVDRLGQVARAAGMELPQLALAWVLRQPGVSSALIGASRPEQVKANVAAVGATLSPEVLAAVDQALLP
ncbi:MAG: aldo/keto reductase family protein [Thermaerobacter sp.]|nr:aldo/keto reductase family protein [Thermaerobacter sp.]